MKKLLMNKQYKFNVAAMDESELTPTSLMDSMSSDDGGANIYSHVGISTQHNNDEQQQQVVVNRRRRRIRTYSSSDEDGRKKTNNVDDDDDDEHSPTTPQSSSSTQQHHQHLAKRWQEQALSLLKNMSTTMTTTATTTTTTSTQHVVASNGSVLLLPEQQQQSYSKSSGNDPNDPMNRYDTVAPELGVGLERWNAIRKSWVSGAFAKEKKTIDVMNRNKQQPMDVDSIVEHLVNPKKPAFQKPVPLGEMINILIEIWESDGLFE